MTCDPVEMQFDGWLPWLTLARLYWPERRLATARFGTANIIDALVHREAGGWRTLWVNAASGTVASVQNIPSAAANANDLICSWNSNSINFET